MSDKPNRATRQLAAEMAERIGISQTEIYDWAMCGMVAAFYNLQEVLADSCEKMSASDFLSIVRQIPRDEDDKGQMLRIQVPAPEGSPEPYATMVRLPAQ